MSTFVTLSWQSNSRKSLFWYTIWEYSLSREDVIWRSWRHAQLELVTFQSWLGNRNMGMKFVSTFFFRFSPEEVTFALSLSSLLLLPSRFPSITHWINSTHSEKKEFESSLGYMRPCFKNKHQGLESWLMGWEHFCSYRSPEFGPQHYTEAHNHP